MKRNMICHALAAAVLASSFASSAATAFGKDPNAREPSAEPEQGRYVNPERIRRRDANPEVETEKNLWKLKYLCWNYKRRDPSTEKIFAALDDDTRLLKTTPAEELADVVVATVAPHSWRDNGGRGSVRSLPGCLIIYQTQKVHAEVVDLLEQLHSHAENPLFG